MPQEPRKIAERWQLPAENAIREAILQVELLPSSTLLTEAVALLIEAKDRVADWVARKDDPRSAI